MIDVPAVGLFLGHVRKLAANHARVTQVGGNGGSRQAKVGQLDVSLLGNQYVVRRHISMNDA